MEYEEVVQVLEEVQDYLLLWEEGFEKPSCLQT